MAYISIEHLSSLLSFPLPAGYGVCLHVYIHRLKFTAQ